MASVRTNACIAERKTWKISDIWTRKNSSAKKKPNPQKLQKERIKQFSIWFHENEAAKDREYIYRRRKRHEKRSDVKKATQKTRLLYIPTYLLLLTGTMALVMSLVPGIGSNTVFWKQKEIFHIVGPVILGCGVIMLMITEAFVNRQRARMRKVKANELSECKERQRAITQTPCIHQERLLNSYFNSEKKPQICRFATDFGVDAETQTDDFLLIDFIQKTHGRGSFKKQRTKVCKMNSVDSAAYSMASSATQFTDLYDDDDDELKSLSEEEISPLLPDNIEEFYRTSFKPVPTINLEENTAGINYEPFITSEPFNQQLSNQMDILVQMESEVPTKNESALESLFLPIPPTRDRSHSEGHINRSFERGNSFHLSNRGSNTLAVPQIQHTVTHVLESKPAALNTSVPNLTNISKPGNSSLSVLPRPAAADRRASWTTFDC